MRDAFAFDDLQRGKEDNPEIQGQGSILQVVLVELHLNGDGQLIPPVDLRPACEPGSKRMHPLLGA